MSHRGEWISATAFAELAGVTRQGAAKALRSRRWRGHTLAVRQVIGRGGKGGMAYQVALDSLPAELREAHTPAPMPLLDRIGPDPRPVAAGQAERIGRRLAAIMPALAMPAGSPERRAALASAADACGQSMRTLYRWIDQYEGGGLNGLGRRRPANAGAARIVVSRRFDLAARKAGCSEDALRELGEVAEKALKGLWASRAEAAGWAEVGRLAEFLILEDCERRGLAVPEAAIRLSRRQVERFAGFRVVNHYRNDRKRFDDAKPRIRRDWTSFAPLQRVVADVKHLDVIVTRPDGSPAWPKLIGFMDAGTGRIFAYPVLLNPGEGVRQEHVVEAFLAMVTDEAWGFPQGLYLDNGSEFKSLDKVNSAIALLNEPGVRTIIYAKPYNASAKPIEALFARLDRYVFSMLPGYAGRDRMAKKTQTVGRPPSPFPGSWDEFKATVSDLIADYHQRPSKGQWGGRSPADWFAGKVAEGWRPVRADPLALDAAFCGRDTRRVDRGAVTIGGQRFTHPRLSALPTRTVIQLALPWRREALPLFQAPGDAWAYLEPDPAFNADWIEGARETSRRQAGQAKRVRALAADAGELDPVNVKRRRVARAVPVAITGRAHVLDAGEELTAVAEGRRLSDLAKPQAVTEAERRHAAKMAVEMARTERLERKQRRVG